MAGNGKVFISHSHDDNERCIDLIAALDAWGVDYWFDAGQAGAQPQLAPATQKAINERDVFIRVCTTNTPRSMGMNMEAGVFRVAQAGVSPRRRSERLFINVILDPLYEREPFDNATLFIDGATRPRAAWVTDLGRALGLDPTARALNRRTFIGLGAAVVVTVAAAAAAGITLAREQVPSNGQSKVTLDLSHTPFGPRWQTTVRKDGTPGVAVAGARLLAVGESDASPTVALSTMDGHLLWSSVRAVNVNGIPPIIAGNTAVITGDGATIYALDVRSGKELWTVTPGDLGGYGSVPTFADGVVYINGDDGVLYAIDASSGTPIWHKTFSLHADTSGAPLSTPLVADGAAYVGSLDGNLYAFDAKTGSVKWKQPTRGPIFSSPAASDGRVYVGSTDHYVYAFQAADGKPLWRFRTGGSVICSPAELDGVLYVGSVDQNLYALDAASGGLYWAVPAGAKDSSGFVSQTDNGVTAKPAVSRAARAVYGLSGGALYGFNVRDGSRRGRFVTGADQYSRSFSPAVSDADGLAFFGAADGVVYAVNL